MENEEGADPRQIVAEGYDRIAERYAQWARDEVIDEARPRFLATLLASLPEGARVLDLGCGGGGPTTQQLAARFALTGVDISARQIELARRALPHATFTCADMTRLEFPPETFDGVAAFYAFLHLPHGELPPLLTRIGEWLRPSGVLVATFGGGADLGTIEPNWLGTPMYFSGYTADDTRRFVEQAGLAITSLCREQILENGRPVHFLWVVARKRVAPTAEGKQPGERHRRSGAARPDLTLAPPLLR